MIDVARNEYSGKFVVRLPVTLHEALTNEASSEGVSLNTLVVAKLCLTLGMSTSACEAVKDLV